VAAPGPEGKRVPRTGSRVRAWRVRLRGDARFHRGHGRRRPRSYPRSGNPRSTAGGAAGSRETATSTRA
jgi:hypothetical protein